MRQTKTFENRVLVHETCTVDWDHSKKAWSLRNMAPGARISKEHERSIVILAFYFSDPLCCKRSAMAAR